MHPPHGLRFIFISPEAATLTSMNRSKLIGGYSFRGPDIIVLLEGHAKYARLYRSPCICQGRCAQIGAFRTGGGGPLGFEEGDACPWLMRQQACMHAETTSPGAPLAPACARGGS
jgi:hypothetical protein